MSLRYWPRGGRQSNFFGADRREGLLVVAGKRRLGIWVLKGKWWRERGCGGGGARQGKMEETPCILFLAKLQREWEKECVLLGSSWDYFFISTWRTAVGTCLASMESPSSNKTQDCPDPINLSFLFSHGHLYWNYEIHNMFLFSYLQEISKVYFDPKKNYLFLSIFKNIMSIDYNFLLLRFLLSRRINNFKKN